MVLKKTYTEVFHAVWALQIIDLQRLVYFAIIFRVSILFLPVGCYSHIWQQMKFFVSSRFISRLYMWSAIYQGWLWSFYWGTNHYRPQIASNVYLYIYIYNCLYIQVRRNRQSLPKCLQKLIFYKLKQIMKL